MALMQSTTLAFLCAPLEPNKVQHMESTQHTRHRCGVVVERNTALPVSRQFVFPITKGGVHADFASLCGSRFKANWVEIQSVFGKPIAIAIGVCNAYTITNTIRLQRNLTPSFCGLTPQPQSANECLEKVTTTVFCHVRGCYTWDAGQRAKCILGLRPKLPRPCSALALQPCLALIWVIPMKMS